MVRTQGLTEQPFFSILIPSYNRPESIKLCLESILSQQFHDLEIIISEDCSPRASEVTKAVQSYLSDERISYYLQETNLREPENKNFLIRKATGKYNIMIADDDEFLPGALNHLKVFVEKNPDQDIYGFGYQVVDEFGYLLETRVGREVVIDSKNHHLMRSLLWADILPLWYFHPATFCCKAGVERELGYQHTVGIGEDLCFMLESVLKGYSIRVLPEALFSWQKVQGTVGDLQTNQSAELLSSFNSRLMMYEYFCSQMELFSEEAQTELTSLRMRERFLYRSLLLDKNLSTESILELDIAAKYQREIQGYMRKTSVKLLRSFPAFDKFCRLVDVAGLIYSVRAFLRIQSERAKYRRRH